MKNEMRGSNPKKPARVSVNVILDGIVLYENLKYTGNNDVWLKNELAKQGISRTEDVFLAMVDGDNKLTVFKTSSDAPENDLFQ